MLSVTKVKLDLVSDVGMYLFLFLIFLKDTAKANNKYLKSYDNKKPTKYITCNGKHEERSWRKTGKQWEKLSEMEIKTKLSNTKNILTAIW